jgi:hypothetical protein
MIRYIFFWLWVSMEMCSYCCCLLSDLVVNRFLFYFLYGFGIWYFFILLLSCVLASRFFLLCGVSWFCCASGFEVSVDLGFDPLILYLNCVGLGIIYLPKFAGHLDLVKVIHQIMVLDLSEKKKKKKLQDRTS